MGAFEIGARLAETVKSGFDGACVGRCGVADECDEHLGPEIGSNEGLEVLSSVEKLPKGGQCVGLLPFGLVDVVEKEDFGGKEQGHGAHFGKSACGFDEGSGGDFRRCEVVVEGAVDDSAGERGLSGTWGTPEEGVSGLETVVEGFPVVGVLGFGACDGSWVVEKAVGVVIGCVGEESESGKVSSSVLHVILQGP